MTQFPSIFGNVLTEGNQNNLQQQMPQSSFGQPVQGKQIGTNVCSQTRNGANDYGMTTTNGLYPNQQQQIHQSMLDSTNPYSNSMYYNNCCIPGSGKQAPQVATMPSLQGYGLLPQNMQDQTRPCNPCTPTSSPIFILPSAGATSNGPVPTYPVPIIPPACIPYPMPLPIYQPQESREGACKCSNNKGNVVGLTNLFEKKEKDTDLASSVEHNCGSCAKYCFNKQSMEDAVCSKQNCLSSIQLQAMVSQLLGIHGIISSTITRILLKQISGSNITESVDDIMKWATRSIRHLPKDQLFKESKGSQEVNGLLRLYLTSSSTISKLIPILTSAQLKSNILKALVENMINAKIMEDQGYGAENPEPLDVLLLELKSDDELRELLSVLREKECQERVNLSFAAYSSQRMIAESKLSNVQRKISQVEKEMDRRHSNGTDQETRKKVVNFYEQNCNYFDSSKSNDSGIKNLISPDPFLDIHLLNVKKLILKPHVGSPETTYKKPDYSKKSDCTESRFENYENCYSFSEKHVNENKSHIEFWEDKNLEKIKSISNETNSSSLLKNINSTENNKNLMETETNLEKIKKLECENLKFGNMNNKDNEDKGKFVVTESNSPINSKNQIQNNKKKN